MRTKNVSFGLFVLGMTFLPFISFPVSAQEPGKWNHLDLKNATDMGEFVRLEPKKQVIFTRVGYKGPIEITLVARASEDAIALRVLQAGVSWDIANGKLTVVGAIEPSITTLSLRPDTWYSLRLKITEDRMEVAVDDKVVFSEKYTHDLSKAKPGRVSVSLGYLKGTVDVKSLDVVALGSQKSVETLAQDDAAKKAAAEKADRDRAAAAEKAKQEPNWDHLDLKDATLMDDFVRITPKTKGFGTKASNTLALKQVYSGPVEITVVARVQNGGMQFPNRIELGAFNGGRVILNCQHKPPDGTSFLRIHRPDAVPSKAIGSEIITLQDITLRTVKWYTVRWKITELGMEVAIDDKVVFSEEGTNDLSMASTIKLIGHTTADIKVFSVKTLAPATEVEKLATTEKVRRKAEERQVAEEKKKVASEKAKREWEELILKAAQEQAEKERAAERQAAEVKKKADEKAEIERRELAKVAAEERAEKERAAERQAVEEKKKSDEKAKIEREELAKKAAAEKAERDRQEPKQPFRILEDNQGAVMGLAFDPKGQTIAAATLEVGKSGQIKLWDAASGRETKLLDKNRIGFSTVAISPDGKILAAGAINTLVRVYDLNGGDPATLDGHSGPISSVTFSPKGTLLASASVDKTVLIWDYAARKENSRLIGHADWVKSICFSPDGSILASASKDRTVKLWDVASGQEKATLSPNAGEVNAIAFSPDGKLLVTAHGDGTIKFWDAKTRLETAKLPGHGMAVLTVAFSPDCKRLATASLDGTIKLWNVAPQKDLRTIKGERLGVYSVAFSPDGKTLASGSQDGRIRLWDIGAAQDNSQGNKDDIITADYLPHRPGTTQNFEVTADVPFTPGEKSVAQVVVTYRDKGLIEQQTKKAGVIKSGNNHVDWHEKPPSDKLSQRFYRTTGDIIEISRDHGSDNRQMWVPELKVGAKSGDSWEHVYEDGKLSFTVRIYQEGGEWIAKVSGREEIKLASGRGDAEFVKTYVKGKGLIEESLTLQVSGVTGKTNVTKRLVENGVVAKPGQITADFLPHKAGTTREYDSQVHLPDGTSVVSRMKVVQRENGVFDEIPIRYGTLGAGKSILNGDEIKWLAPKADGRPLDPQKHHRIKDGFVEIGWQSPIKGAGMSWMPCLKIGAKEGDSWKFDTVVGVAEFKVKGFTNHNGQAAVVVEQQRDGTTVTKYTYVAGVGEVEQVQFKDGKPFMITKMVDEPDAKIKKQSGLPKDGKEATAKKEPAKKADETPAAAKVVPTEITADFSPHKPGTVQHYDAQMTLPDGKAAVIRRRVTQKDDGVIDSTTVRIGSLNAGESILKGDKVTWLKDLNQPSPSPTFHRNKGDFIENGSSIEGMDGVQWEPILKIGAKDGDIWKWDTKMGTVEYRATLGLSHAGIPEVVIHTSRTKPLPMTQTLRYVKGIGEVERVSIITFKDNNKQTGIIKLVEEDGKQQQGNAEPGKVNANVVVIETTLGQIKVELFRDKAPITVKNFLQYVDDKFYDGTIIHRVIPNFMIQGGGLLPGLLEKNGRESIKNESSNALSNKRGTIAMARTIVADSATSQFFINVKDNPLLDRARSGDKVGYCVFGQVIEGMEVVDAIRQVATGKQGGHSDVPTVDVVIKSIRRLPPSATSIEPSSTGHGSVKVKDQSGLGNQGVFKVDEKLTNDDPKDRTRTFSVHKVHTVKLFAGKSYTIDLVSRDFDSYLRLENSAGQQLAEDDDSGGDLNARIVFQAPKDDTYRIIATSFDGKTGNYTLTIREGEVKPNSDKGTKVPAKQPEAIPGAKKLDARVKTTSKENQDQNFTQHLQKLTVLATEKQIILDFDVDQKNWQPVTRSFSLIVRVFDKDGKYLTHFVTKESFTASPDVYDGWMEVVNRLKEAPPNVQAELLGGFTPKLLQANGNRLVYGVNPAVLRNGAIVEVGFIHVKQKVPF